MSTQYAAFPPLGLKQERPIPRHLKKAHHLREEVFRYIGDATTSREFMELYVVLGRYLQKVPKAVREELDRLEYGE